MKNRVATGQVSGQVKAQGAQVTPPVGGQPESRPEWRPESQPESLREKIVSLLTGGPLSKADIAARLGQKQVSGQLNKVIRDMLREGVVAHTIPEKPQSRMQRYKLAGWDES